MPLPCKRGGRPWDSCHSTTVYLFEDRQSNGHHWTRIAIMNLCKTIGWYFFLCGFTLTCSSSHNCISASSSAVFFDNRLLKQGFFKLLIQKNIHCQRGTYGRRPGDSLSRFFTSDEISFTSCITSSIQACLKLCSPGE